jgi:hypothetical protein
VELRRRQPPPPLADPHLQLVADAGADPGRQQGEEEAVRGGWLRRRAGGEEEGAEKGERTETGHRETGHYR